ncbi:hypothetical protein [Xanthomarina sp. F2636L]|uniref:hypothetical protein n=1 Tax=Xanthomarina sp. F2636L TaxID=2996018 RepID=UPI00225DE37F|nr:hypothetical protein [Xanthomarina sp. F2636L]MCX7550545.1 hypothetical protein [Xanthomarina sp. F2636L]
MKFKLILLITLFTFTNLISQTNGINYKAIVKDENGNPLTNAEILIQFVILKGASQTNVYQEVHMPDTDANGLVILNIGEGTPVYGTFNAIDWASDDHFLMVLINTGGPDFVNLGTTQLKTVPYALHSNSSDFATESTHSNSSDFATESTTAFNLSLKDGTNTKFNINYHAPDDNLRITETGTGSVLEIKNGEFYLPQYAGNNNGSLKVDATGKVISEIIGEYIFNRFELPIIDEYSTYTRLRRGVQIPDGTVLAGIKAILKDNDNSGSYGVHNTAYAGLYRANKYAYNENSILPIYIIDGSDTPNGMFSTFTQTTLSQSNSDIIDNENYIYFIQVWYCNDCDITEFTIMKF